MKKGVHPGIQVAVALGLFYLFIKFAIQPPLPFSLIFMYMSLAVVGSAVYLALFYDLKEAVIDPLFRFFGGGIEGGVAKGCRYMILVAMPLLVWWISYEKMGAATEPPLAQRVIHPAPPGEYTGLYNPYRVEEEGGHTEFLKSVEEGKEVYFKNCVFCHGDLLNGKGIFAHGFNPLPADFQDPGTIAMLQESFLFWRISTGGIGLPMESTPWDSAMPRWETMLSEEQRWKVILFLYEYTGRAPRTWE